MENTNIEKSINSLSQSLRELIEAAHRPVSQEVTQFLEFRAKPGSSNIGKGIIWNGDGTSKQLIYNNSPDRFFSTENFELIKDKSFLINGKKILDEQTLGSSVVKSNLEQLGTLKGLVVNGAVRIDQNVFYDPSKKRLGLGTDFPNSDLGIKNGDREIVIGFNQLRATIGTWSCTDVDIVTDNTKRITVKHNGDIDIGNEDRFPCQVKLHGKLSVGVTNPDKNVDLHVAGDVRLNNRLYTSSSRPPVKGTFSVGDICWNSQPKVGGHVGWICLRAGSPGSWYSFGMISDTDK